MKTVYLIEKDNKAVDVFANESIARMNAKFFGVNTISKVKDGKTAFIWKKESKKDHSVSYKAEVYNSAIYNENEKKKIVKAQSLEELLSKLNELSIELFIYKN